MMVERWHYSLVQDIEPMDFDDFIMFADMVNELNQRDIKSQEEAASRRRK